MDYLQKKYKGYKTVSTSSLQDELLLSAGEYLLMKKEVAAALNSKNCPSEIPFGVFDSLVDLYL